MHITKLFTRTVWASYLCTCSAGLFASDEHHSHVNLNPTVHTESHPIKMRISENQHGVNAQLNTVHQVMPDMGHVDSKHTETSEFNLKDPHPHDDHRKEHGAQIYAVTTVDHTWSLNKDGDGTLKSEIEARIGSDENKLFLKAHLDKHESHDPEYEFKGMYSRMISDFWDAQIGARYRVDKFARNQQGAVTEENLDAVMGLHGLAPYFFETDAYVYIGKEGYAGLSVDTARDLLVTQRWILQPYLNLDVVLSDDSKYAQRSGLSQVEAGIETRYEISKNIMPYMTIAYSYAKGRANTPWRVEDTSEKSWLYGLGLRLKF